MTDEQMSRDNNPRGDFPDDWDAEEEALAAEAGRTMFECLHHGGYDRVEVEYDARAGELNVLGIALFKGHTRVENNPLVGDLQRLVKSYLCEVLPDGWGYEAGSYGEARLYPASRFAVFQHIERNEEYLPFTRGVHGPDVPESEWLW